jgi:hypothetical protein
VLSLAQGQLYLLPYRWRHNTPKRLFSRYFNVLNQRLFHSSFQQYSCSQRSGSQRNTQTSGICISTGECQLWWERYQVCVCVSAAIWEVLLRNVRLCQVETIIRRCHSALGEITCVGLCRLHWRETHQNQVFRGIWLRVAELPAVLLHWRMPYFGMWRRVTLVRTNVLQESIASNIKVKRISELGATLAVTSIVSAPSQRASVDTYC